MKFDQRPSLIFWEITPRCNLSCILCYEASEKAVELSPEKVNSIIQQIIECKPLSVDIGGGEPLLKENIFTILKTLTDAGLTVRLVTNGIIERAEELKKVGVNSLQMSFDGFKQDHEKIRGPNSYERSIESLKKYIRLGFDIGVTTVITSYNIKDIPEMAKYFHELGAKRFIPTRFVPTGRGELHQELWVDEKATKDLHDKLKVLKKDLGAEFLRTDCALDFFDGDDLDSGRVACTLGEKTIGIKTNGDIGVCPFLPTVFGNIEKDRLLDVWNSKALNDLREAISADKLEGKCVDCPEKAKKVCRGGCRVLAYHMHDNIKAPDPRCWR